MEKFCGGIILGGMQSSSGKTAITCLILAALRQRQIPFQPFKVGPDFIDPGYHAFYADAPSRNLDEWLMGTDRLRHEAFQYATNKLGVVEGVMGLFDGSNVHSEEGSTMSVARLLNWPIVLIVPAAKAGRSLAAALRGFIETAGPEKIAGVILNGISGNSHREYLHDAIAPLKLPILGALPKLQELDWSERHLGLQASQECQLPARGAMASLAEQHLDLNAILQIASRCTPPLPAPVTPTDDIPSLLAGKKIAIAQDEAFHFYYASNLDFLRTAGAELIPFSPLHDTSLPKNVSGIILGGGFPEVFASRLADNTSMRKSVHDAISNGMRCYAECGGLMYLSETLRTTDGNAYPMVGMVPGAITMTQRLCNFGYCLAVPQGDANRVHGHEFHYSRWEEEPAHANLWHVQKKNSGKERMEGFKIHNLHASYVHLYFPTARMLSDMFREHS